MIPTDVDVIIADQNFDTFWDWLIPILFCFPILEVFVREISFCGCKCVRFSRAQERYGVIVILVKIILP